MPAFFFWREFKMTNEKSDYGKPTWDPKIASELQGAIVLVGITYVDQDDKPVSKTEFYGVVTEVDETRGVAIECHGSTLRGQTYWLPPDLRAFFRAKPGSYRLHSTGEKLVDPDYTTTWTITQPEHQPQ